MSHDSKLNSDCDHILILPIFSPYHPTLQIPMYLLMAQLTLFYTHILNLLRTPFSLLTMKSYTQQDKGFLFD